jgi:peroxiredoxin
LMRPTLQKHMSSPHHFRPAPEWEMESWLNTDAPIKLADLRGKVVVLHAFQMLCPGCIHYGVPQAQKVHDFFSQEDVVVIGLHSVFENHEAMTRRSLETFAHEFRLSFPIGVDQRDGADPIPITMQRYGLRGTPSLVLIDRQGRIRKQSFGPEDDMKLGAEIATLLCESPGG